MDMTSPVPQLPNESAERGRWTSRTAFILAAIGSAIGLGNFWRFPYLLYKYGGGVFLIPYVLALFFIGIPLLQLEVTIGQLFQKGNAKALAAMSPKMIGVGYAAAFSAFTIVSYYVMIIAWVCIYFIQSFKSELPWTNATGEPACYNGDGVPADQAEYYLYHDVLGAWTTETNETGQVICSFRAQDGGENIQWTTFGVLLVTWALVYLCVFRGVHHTSKVVYVTVLLPIVILMVLFFRAITLPGASIGIDAYIANWDFSKLKNADIWVDAVSQIFFSLSLSSAVMVSFGSYNKRDKPVLADSFVIALSNSFFSIISGFVVWSTLGFYADSRDLTIAELPQQNLQSLGLVFITYPLALREIPGTNFWCIMLVLNLFMLGIDSAFSLVEGFFAVIEDTKLGSKLPRPVLLFVTILPCMLLGIFYSQDTGLYWFDAVDHYVQYIMLFSACLHAFTVGWMKGTISSEKLIGTKSSYLYTMAYTFSTIALVAITVSTASLFRSEEDEGKSIVSYEILLGGIAFFAILLPLVYMSFKSSKKSSKEWFSAVSLSGPLEFTNHWKLLGSTTHPTTGVSTPLGSGTGIMDKLATFYVTFWSIMVKYVIPISLAMLLLVGIRGDILSRYSGYIDRYLMLGWFIFLFGVLLSVVPMVFNRFYPKANAENPLPDNQVYIQENSKSVNIL